MNRRTLSIIVMLLLAPFVARFAWFFPGFAVSRAIATPDYANLKMPQPPLSTPLAVAAVPVKSGTGSVLIDVAHANQFHLPEIGSLTGALTQSGGSFVLNSDAANLASQLKSASSYLVISPSSAFKPDEIALVKAFVNRGGRLAVFTDATRGAVQYDFFGNIISSEPDVNVVNPLLEPFGMVVNADYLYDLDSHEGNFRNVYLSPPGKADLTAGVGKVTFYGTHSLSSVGGRALLLGGSTTLSSSSDAAPEDQAQPGWATAVVNKDGNVLAFGDFSFLSAPYDAVTDNRTLINNIANFLLAVRPPALADYPYLFRSPTVSLVTASDLQLSADLTDAVSKLQASVTDAGSQLRLVQSAPAKGDTIILGTYTSADELASYLKPFAVKIDGDAATVTLQPFGKLGQSGSALVLFRSIPSGNTLVLLAYSADDVTSLLDALTTGSLDGCVLQGNAAACGIGSGGSFMQDTPTPEASPTASG